MALSVHVSFYWWVLSFLSIQELLFLRTRSTNYESFQGEIRESDFLQGRKFGETYSLFFNFSSTDFLRAETLSMMRKMYFIFSRFIKGGREGESMLNFF